VQPYTGTNDLNIQKNNSHVRYDAGRFFVSVFQLQINDLFFSRTLPFLEKYLPFLPTECEKWEKRANFVTETTNAIAMITVNIDSIDAYHRLYGLPTLHPLVSVVDLSTMQKRLNHIRINYGIYALFLKNGAYCSIKYGRKSYDYQEGSVVSFSPGQVVEVDMPDDAPLSNNVLGLLFHPDLMYGTPLARKISDFRFFDYSQMESLHLSERERKIFTDCLDNIRCELEQPVDGHSASVLAAGIQLLLEYLHRFYDRQFITRHKVNSEVVARFERNLKAYYDGGRTGDNVPSVAEFAAMANLSTGYFSDLVKKETGLAPKDMIMRHLIDVAKHRLAVSSDDVSVIAYDLGFQYPAHFSRAFKRVAGMSPSEFRRQLECN